MATNIVTAQGIGPLLSRILTARGFAAHAGASIGAVDYIANCANATALTTGAMAAGTLRALPFVAPARGGTLDRIAAEVTTAAASQNIRLGLYRNKTGEADIYPGALLADSGSISSGTTGVKSYSLSQALEPGKIYWLVLNTSASITMRGLAVGGVSHFLGMATAATTALNLYISATLAYGAMPDPFTAGGAYVTAVPCPVLRYRFSA